VARIGDWAPPEEGVRMVFAFVPKHQASITRRIVDFVAYLQQKAALKVDHPMSRQMLAEQSQR
jgi:hypothetical protein